MKARKKPIEIEYYPCHLDFLKRILEWSTPKRPITQWRTHDHKLILSIVTLEGTHQATENDMIIKWIQWEVYPCKKDIFEATYNIIS